MSPLSLGAQALGHAEMWTASTEQLEAEEKSVDRHLFTECKLFLLMDILAGGCLQP